MVQGPPPGRNRRRARGRTTHRARARLDPQSPCAPQEPGRRPYRDSHNSRRDDSKTPKVGRSCSSHATTSKSSTATSVWVGSSSPVNSVVVNTAIALCAALDTPEWRYGRASLFGEGSLWTQREIEPPTGD